jgi:uncharacterized glyoxalase superfamily protein PhnB
VPGRGAEVKERAPRQARLGRCSAPSERACRAAAIHGRLAENAQEVIEMSHESDVPRCHTVTPYLIVRGVPALLEFLANAFRAEMIERVERPDGSIMHAEVRIGDSVVMMGEPADEAQVMPASLYLLVDDADAVYARAMEAGAASVREPVDQSYGRSAGVRDTAGNVWWITRRGREA